MNEDRVHEVVQELHKGAAFWIEWANVHFHEGLRNACVKHVEALIKARDALIERFNLPSEPLPELPKLKEHRDLVEELTSMIAMVKGLR